MTSLHTRIRTGEAAGNAPVRGPVLHAGGPSERGVHGFDVRQATEDAEPFFAERSAPTLRRGDALKHRWVQPDRMGPAARRGGAPLLE